VESLRVRPGDTDEFTDETRIRARSGSIRAIIAGDKIHFAYRRVSVSALFSAAIAFPRRIARANIDSALSACFGKASSPLSARRDFCEKIYAIEQRRECTFARIREIIGSLDTFHLHGRLIANGSIKRALFTAAPHLRYAPRY